MAAVRVRAIRPDDEPRLMVLWRGLSPHAVPAILLVPATLLAEEAADLEATTHGSS
jgi:hypothetical protein